MKINKLIIVASIFLLVASCTTTRLFTSGVKPAEIQDLQKFETISYISLIQKGNMGKLNDSVSAVSKAIFDEALSSFGNKIPVSGEINTGNPNLRKRLQKEIESLILSADKHKKIETLKLTPVIDSLLEANGKRFGLLTVTSGFTREKGNYGKQVAKGAAVGLLTLGMAYQTPIKANSTVYAMIVDAQENNIAFYKKSFVEADPLTKEVLTKQLNKLFESYSWAKE